MTKKASTRNGFSGPTEQWRHCRWAEADRIERARLFRLPGEVLARYIAGAPRPGPTPLDAALEARFFLFSFGRLFLLKMG